MTTVSQVPLKAEVLRSYARVLDGAYLDKVISSPSRGAGGERDYLLTGLLQQKLTLEWLVARLVPRPQQLPEPVKHILALAFLQLRSGRIPAAVVVNEGVLLSRKMGYGGFSGLVNGVLRRYLRRPPMLREKDFAQRDAYLEVRYSLPRWIIRRLLQAYAPAAKPEEILTSLQKRPPRWLRVNRRVWSPEEFEDWAAKAGVSVFRRENDSLYYRWEGPVSPLKEVQPGGIHFHDLSASAAVDLLQLREGQRVLDCCAAPGGKLLQLLEAVPGLEITALERDSGRLRALERRLEGESQSDCCRLVAGDLREFPPGKWDRVLLDVPCTGSGNYGRKPDSRYRRTESHLAELVLLQRELLEKGAKLLRPGGILVYSTCSIFPEENREQIQWLLERNPRLHLRQEIPDGHPGSRGLVRYLPWEQPSGGSFAAALELEL